MSKYQGWTNYETWAVNLWLENSEGDYREWTERADAAFGEVIDKADEESYDDCVAEAAHDLARDMRNELAEAAPDLGCTLWADLLSAALSEVDWYEIATAWVQTARENRGVDK